MPKPGPPRCGQARNADGRHHPSASVGISTTKTAGSNGVAGRADKAVNGAQAPEIEIVAANLSEVQSRSEVKSATPTLADLSAAARVLARRPRRSKKWSGWLGRTRMWRLREVVLPSGQVLPAYVVRRGWVYVVLPDTPEYEGRVFERHRAQDVQVYRSPDAALLGGVPARPGSRPRGRPSSKSNVGTHRARTGGGIEVGRVEVYRNPYASALGRLKTGTRKRKSDLKVQTSRQNGTQPCRPGSQPRGRPPRR